jgi:hypothetical protein
MVVNIVVAFSHAVSEADKPFSIQIWNGVLCWVDLLIFVLINDVRVCQAIWIIEIIYDNAFDLFFFNWIF